MPTTITTVFAAAAGLRFICRPGQSEHYGGGDGHILGSIVLAIVFGLSFATVLTLVATPALLVLPVQLKVLLRKIGMLGRRSTQFESTVS